MEDSLTNNSSQPDRFDVSFGNGALKKLKELGVYLSVPEDKLGEVLIKGMKIIEVAKDYGDGKLCIEDKDGKKVLIDVKEL